MDRGTWRAAVLRDEESRKDTTQVTEHARTHARPQVRDYSSRESPHLPGLSRGRTPFPRVPLDARSAFTRLVQEFRPRGGTAVASLSAR